jgi:hypothetical protein
MPDIYKEDGPTAKKIRKLLEDESGVGWLVLALAKAIDELREQTGVSEYARLQEEARKGYEGE